MDNHIVILIKLFLASFCINFLSTRILIKYSLPLNLLDKSNDRKVHEGSVPVVGGLGIFVTISILFIYLFFNGWFVDYLNTQTIIAVIFSTVILFLTGLLDDLYNLSPFNKFLFQLIAALVFLIGSNLHFKSMFFIDYDYINFILNVLFIIGITNAFNLLDGLDGLAGGVSLIICFTLIVLYSLSSSAFFQIAIMIIMAGSLSSFLIYNKSPAKTFLGDTGSLFIGWYFSLASIYFAQKTTLSLSILLPFMIMGLPAFDVLYVMISRFIKRHNYNIPFTDRFKGVFYPDNTHLHHLFLRGGLSKFKTVVLIYIITFISGCVCLFSWINKDEVDLIYGFLFISILVFLIRSYIELRIKKRKK